MLQQGLNKETESEGQPLDLGQGVYFAKAALLLAALILVGITILLAVLMLQDQGKRASDLDPGQALIAATYVRAFLFGIALNTSGIVFGLVLCYLGLSLFLFGTTGSMKAKGALHQAKFEFDRIAPGTLVMLVGAAVVALCIHDKPVLDLDAVIKTTVGPTSGSQNQSFRDLKTHTGVPEK
jgi:hypothetical protein